MKRSNLFNDRREPKRETPRVRQPEVNTPERATVVVNPSHKREQVKEEVVVTEVKKPKITESTIPIVGIDKIGETIVSVNKELPAQKCHVVDFSKHKHSEKALIKLHSFYPDSRMAIINDLTLDVSYAAYLDEETYIFTESPMTNPLVVAVLSIGVIVELRDVNEALTTYLITKEGFTPIPFLNSQPTTDEFEINGKLFSTRSTQNKLPDITDDITSYYYEDVRYDIYPDGRLIEYNLEKHRRLLLADTKGCYVTFYITLNDEEYHNINGKHYRVLGRVAKTFCLLQERKTEVLYALSVRGFTLIELEKITNDLPTLSKSKYNGIKNGVPMLTKHSKLARDITLTVFSPKLSKIVVSKGSFADTSYISNGVYLPDEQILLMHDGAIIFVTEEEEQTLTINKTGKVIQKGYGHLGDLNE